MFKTIEKCPLCGSKKKSKITINNSNVYSFFLTKILDLNENYILKNMQNYKCSECDLIYKKKWLKKNLIKKIYLDFQPTHPGGLNTLKINFGKKKFISLFNKYRSYLFKKNHEHYDQKKREMIKILNNTNNNSQKYIKLKKKFINKLNSNDIDYLNSKYLMLSRNIKRPKIHSQFCGFRSKNISNYLNKKLNLKSIYSYAEVGCPLWGNYDHFKKPWIQQYFKNIEEVNFWKIDKRKNNNCINYLSKRVKLLTKTNSKKIDFVGIYNFLDHLENPLKFFRNEFKNVKYYGIICEDISLSKKIDCQHFTSWNHKSLNFLAKKIGYTIYHKPLRLNNSVYKLYILTKNYL